MLKIYNSLTKQKELFIPIQPGTVRIYVCGMTVYDYCHLGHARVLVVFDVVVRYLRQLGYDVTYVRNITDIDDKIIARANERQEHFTELTRRFTEAMHQDAAALGVLPPDREPRATQSLPPIIRMIERLLQRGHAYVASNGDVYYDVSSFPTYGKLSGKNPEELRAGARVELNEAKDDPLDFALWKLAKPEEPSWDSPWGKGRPGWHIECSAMSTQELGAHFDIHGGGMDLQFPHHENEIAQSEGASGETFANVWMHNGFVRVNEEKMSKSLGNFFTVREILERYRPEEVRYFILTSHYRSPLNYSNAQLETARAALNRLYLAMRGLPETLAKGGEPYADRFREAMDDDFNTPEALAVLFELVREINRIRGQDPAAAASLAAVLRNLGGNLGLLGTDPEVYLKEEAGPSVTNKEAGLSNAEIEDRLAQRQQARSQRNWAEADRIRDELTRHGVILEDGPKGTIWRRQ